MNNNDTPLLFKLFAIFVFVLPIAVYGFIGWVIVKIMCHYGIL